MLRDHRGNIIDIHKEADQDRLRGGRLQQIKEDLTDTEADSGERYVKYSSHIEWFLKKMNYLHAAQEHMMRGRWKTSLYSLGVTNGLVMAMSIFLEEQADPPYRKIPDELGDGTRMISEEARDFMVELAKRLRACIITPDDKPYGYADFPVQEAWSRWLGDTVATMKYAPFEMKRLKDVTRQVEDHLVETGEDYIEPSTEEE